MSQPSRPKSPDDQTAMYIRVKRLKTTYFLQCVPSETILQIKEKLQELIDEPVNNQRLILMPDKETLDDSKSLADQKVENDAVVALTLRKDDEFEEVNIARPDEFYQSREADGGSNW
ncbi:Ubiquitin-like superfamily protein [Striga hermonthica]|uniref:Ubiquitin-like superfamily protein n=1 Tax=Striga hermonthica TaxID=68872 RepID=A0A9N7MT57_STRHE|nr:Ubiquitin-like superfamily protein [Striga hermonthica]